MVDSMKNNKCTMDKKTRYRIPAKLIIDRKKKLHSRISKAENYMEAKKVVMELIHLELGLRVHEINATQVNRVKR